jgi:hypothetical protein
MRLSEQSLARFASVAAIGMGFLAGCASADHRPAVAPRDPDVVRAEIADLLPANVSHRAGWAVDIYAAFDALKLDPTRENLCAVLAVTAQESSFEVDPPVADLPKIARQEISRRAASHHVPGLVVDAALALRSPDGRSYAERLEHAHTEEALSDLYEDFIGMVPLGSRLFAGLNPIRTVGPMQVSVTYAERFAGEKPYPYPRSGSVRHELFTRRGGMYFGIAHLLAYRAGYNAMLFRFADYNAGRYASREAAFQRAVSIASNTPLATDGDLRGADPNVPSKTELAIRTIGDQIAMSDAQIRSDLEQGRQPGFGRTTLYKKVFALAERRGGHRLAHAQVPQIALAGPKIARRLTTQWYAQRVNGRYQQCLHRGSG